MTDKELVYRVRNEELIEKEKMTDEDISKLRKIEAAISILEGLEDDALILLVKTFLKRMDDEELDIKKGFLDWVEPYLSSLEYDHSKNTDNIPIERRYAYEVLFLTFRQLRREVSNEYHRRGDPYGIYEIFEKGKIAKHYGK